MLKHCYLEQNPMHSNFLWKMTDSIPLNFDTRKRDLSPWFGCLSIMPVAVRVASLAPGQLLFKQPCWNELLEPTVNLSVCKFHVIYCTCYHSVDQSKGTPNYIWTAYYALFVCHSTTTPKSTDTNVLTHDDVIKWKHFPRYWPFVREIHRSPVNFPHKGEWRGALMFALICVWINGWVNNREAGDLRRYRGHYDVIVMITRVINGGNSS